MKTMMRALLIAALALPLGATETPKAQTMTGYVTNKACDPVAMKADAAACMKKCRENGGAQFVDDAKNEVWTIANGEKIAGLEGKHVSLTATVDAAKKTITVVTVTPDKK
jgi:hypothetical protein